MLLERAVVLHWQVRGMSDALHLRLTSFPWQYNVTFMPSVASHIIIRHVLSALFSFPISDGGRINNN